ncbi:hypothetical protein PS9374_07175 [Planomonospora sphaerica]|uniref:Uncharacterized protein n=1 Tax=Planomonospora sphaerica TaxID=161355 RepID=A0A171DR04_9ACTN|nr:hypothetical protein PS9374_07175 [Planomonospora sphaerica]
MAADHLQQQAVPLRAGQSGDPPPQRVPVRVPFPGAHGTAGGAAYEASEQGR